jgi:uncharacterized protein (DUF2336 family)
MTPAPAFYQEVEHAIKQSSSVRRSEMAQSLTDLLLLSTANYTDDELTVIDDVFVRLVVTIEESARALLATRLAPLSKAPAKILRALACDDVIAVASPILTQSEALDERTLIECASTKSREHLLAISQRKNIAQAVTDILIDRGDRSVILSTARNAGAQFSNRGFAALVSHSQSDDRLALCVGSRPDIPAPLFRQLLDSASGLVRAKLEAESPHLKRDIGRAVAKLATGIETQAAVLSPKYAAAAMLVKSLNHAGKLNPGKLEAFATANRFEDTVAALALMSGVPIETVDRKLNEEFVAFLLIVAKATGLSWLTTKVILLMLGVRNHRCAADEAEQSLTNFQQLTRQDALQSLSVYRVPDTN